MNDSILYLRSLAAALEGEPLAEFPELAQEAREAADTLERAEEFKVAMVRANLRQVEMIQQAENALRDIDIMACRERTRIVDGREEWGLVLAQEIALKAREALAALGRREQSR